MKFNFILPQFPGSGFEFQTSVWTGKTRLYKDDVEVERSENFGKPFLIPTADGSYIKTFLKRNLPDILPIHEVKGKEIQLAEKLEWYQSVLCWLPLLLLFIGGMIGGLFGAMGTYLSLVVFRQKGNAALKYIKVFGVVVATFLLYFVMVGTLSELLS